MNMALDMAGSLRSVQQACSTPFQIPMLPSYARTSPLYASSSLGMLRNHDCRACVMIYGRRGLVVKSVSVSSRASASEPEQEHESLERFPQAQVAPEGFEFSDDARLQVHWPAARWSGSCQCSYS